MVFKVCLCATVAVVVVVKVMGFASTRLDSTRLNSTRWARGHKLVQEV